MSALLDLAARCEAATGPDRELDARIWCALKGYRFIKMGERGDTWGDIEGSYRKSMLMEGWAVFEHPKPSRQNGGRFQQYSCRGDNAYTASLDAAMTLVPEGFFWTVGYDAENIYSQVVDNKWREAECFVGGGFQHAATPALALCAAALRARA